MSTYIRRQEITHEVGARGRVTLQVNDADVRVTGAPMQAARVVATFELSATSDDEASRLFDALKLRVAASAGGLTVEQQDQASVNPLLRLIGRGGGASLQIEATVPTGAVLRVETVSGDVNTTQLEGDQRYATVSGDLVILAGAGSVRLSTVSGDAVLRAHGALALRAESVSGDLGVTAARLDALRASTVSGDIDVEGALRPGGEHRIETVSGDVTFAPVGGASFEVRGLSTDISGDIDHRIEGRADRRHVIVGGGGPEVVFSSMSGDFHVRRPRDLEPEEDETARRAETMAEQADDLDVLRALERGDIDVEEAGRRLGNR
ncbi:MAG: DUF4097 family beta strand repeat-containing protein [Chloroflexota bacterium]